MAGNSDYQKVAERYTTALIDLAVERKNLDAVEKDLNDLSAMLSNSEEFRAFVETPLLSREVKMETIGTIATKAKLNAVTINFLLLLAKNRRIQNLEGILVSALKAISKMKGELTAHIGTAQTLSDKQTKDLKAALKKGFGKEVNLDIQQDEELLGGMVIRVGSLIVDDSVRTKLNVLQRRLKEGNVNLNLKTEEVA